MSTDLVCDAVADEPTVQRLLRLDRPGPRYTSYPTAPTWRKDPGDAAFVAALGAIRGPVQVYVHVPFCKEQCWFCGCNMVVAGRRDAGDRYLDALATQLEALPFDHRDAARIHLGGGTPTWLDVPQLERLFGLLRTRFTTVAGAELSVEIDPDVTSDAQIDALHALGVNRLSIGVQSFDPIVLAAIHRPQDPGRIGAILQRARGYGMRGLNLDLVYGLPHQTMASLDDTLDRVLELRPDRIALYSFAHVPWVKSHQQKLDAAALPGPAARLASYLRAAERLVAAGYVAIGMDHFALADDELAVAQREGRLHRNFMGYTTRADVALVGLGPSAISELDGMYAQQQPALGKWYRAVAGREALIEKACVLTAEDRLRRDVIAALMCSFVVDYAAIEGKHGIRFGKHFATELEALGTLVDEGLVVVGPDRIDVTPIGRLLVRNVAMVFDAYLGGDGQQPRFSRTV
jgi:oxygen-independent coproporphyrinogen-3 oxidase